MKRVIVLILMLLILPTILAVEFDVKENYDQGETLMARLSGTFLDLILDDNIVFYRGHVRVPMEFELGLMDEDYYIYAVLPENEANYSIAIENIRYMVGGQVSEEDLIYEFVISNQTAIFSIKPGLIFAEDNFKITVQNLQPEEIIINYQALTDDSAEANMVEEESGFFGSLFGGGSESEEEDVEGFVELKSGEIQDIEFKLGIIMEDDLKFVTLSSGDLNYEVPIYVYKNYVELNETIEEDMNETIDDNETIIIKNGTEEETEPKEGSLLKTCEELQGKFCKDNEKCSAEIISAKDGDCCLEECKIKEKSSFGKWIGGILVLGIIGFLIWFFKFKYRGAKKKVNLMDVALKGAGK